MQLDVFPPFSRAPGWKGSALQCVLNALTPRPALDKPRNYPSSRWNPQTGRIFRDNTQELCPRDKAAVVIVVIAGSGVETLLTEGEVVNSVNLGLTVNRGWG